MTVQNLKKEIITNLDLSLNLKSSLNYGLLSGDFGIVYAMYYLSKDLDSSIDVDKYLDKVLFSIHKLPLIYSYCNGISGLGYGLYRLQNDKFISNASANLSFFDKVIHNWYIKCLNQAHIDPLHGALGALYYFITRLDYNPKLLHDVINRWINYLENNIEKTINGYTVGFRTFGGTPPYNLSLSHGLSGLITITVNALEVQKHIPSHKIHNVLQKLGSYLINIICNNNNCISLYSSFGEYKATTHPSRMAWCYGDLGIAYALFRLGKYLNILEYIETSKRIILHSAKRTSSFQTMMWDKCICHGSTGVYQFFKFFNKNIFNGELDKIVNFWYQYSFNKALTDSSKISLLFRSYDNNEEKFHLKNNILDGISGIGLSLLKNDTILNNIIFIK